MKKRPELTELQVELMRVLWERGEASAAEVWSALRPRRRLATTTVATLLTRLERRGVVGHRVEGRTYIYRPRVAEAEVRSSLLGRVKDAFAGDVSALFAQFLDEHDVDGDDLARMRELIETKERELEEGS
ncbi:MAG: BlaI/MecI/CopY family transcriptional regulator [Longimicrobiales bacterium]